MKKVLTVVLALSIAVAVTFHLTRGTSVAVPLYSSLACPSEKPAKYEFTTDWFTDQGRPVVWDTYVKPLAGKPLNYLEVGIFEGRSMVWMLENVLTHPESKATGIDIKIQPRYLANLSKAGGCERVKNIQAPSQEAMKYLPKESFDVIYIDGGHMAKDVIADAVLAFDLLKVGGLMVFDDYEWLNHYASDLTPKLAIDAFVTTYRHELKVVHKGYQYLVQKKANPCPDRWVSTPIGEYCYRWNMGDLWKGDKRIHLSQDEKSAVEAIAKSVHIGGGEIPTEKYGLAFKNIVARF